MSALTNAQEASPCNWSRADVQRFASDVAKKLGFSPGDNVEQLIERLGGRVAKSDWESARETGSITVRGPRDFQISLSPLSGDRRSRFTIAHELGHYILHARAGKKPLYIRRDGSGPVEWEANWFAAGFLMPEDVFRTRVAEGFGDAELAEHFGVSKEAVQIRRQALSL
jgi:IrrE N-terminal-like domain